MELLLGIQADAQQCEIGFIQGNGFCGDAPYISTQAESYASFCEKVSRATLRLLSTPDGIRPITAVGVVVDGIVHNNIVLSSSALPFLVGKPLADDLGRVLGQGNFPIGLINNVAAALLGSHSEFHDPMRGVELAGALEFASNLSKTR